MAKEDTAPTQLDKLKKLREQAAKLEAEVKDSLLSQASQAVKELEELGFTYHLLSDEDYQRLYQPVAPVQTDGKKRGRPAGSTNQPKPKEAPTTPSANYNAEKFCKTCKEYGHEGRKHRTHKERFTNEELSALGLLPPEVSNAQ